MVLAPRFDCDEIRKSTRRVFVRDWLRSLRRSVLVTRNIACETKTCCSGHAHVQRANTSNLHPKKLQVLLWNWSHDCNPSFSPWPRIPVTTTKKFSPSTLPIWQVRCENISCYSTSMWRSANNAYLCLVSTGDIRDCWPSLSSALVLINAYHVVECWLLQVQCQGCNFRAMIFMQIRRRQRWWNQQRNATCFAMWHDNSILNASNLCLLVGFHWNREVASFQLTCQERVQNVLETSAPKRCYLLERNMNLAKLCITPQNKRPRHAILPRLSSFDLWQFCSVPTKLNKLNLTTRLDWLSARTENRMSFERLLQPIHNSL